MSNFALSPLDVAIIVGETALVVAVGLWAARRMDKTSQGYFLASGQMPWWLIGSAFVSTSVSSEQLVGTVGAAYEHGMGIANWEWWSLPTYLLVIVFFIPLYLKNRVTTVPDFLTRRFGPACGAIYSYVMLVVYVLVFLAAVLYGGSLTLSPLTGWRREWIAVGLAAVIGLYTIKGGLGSVMWADAVQCVLLLVGGIALFFVALDEIPGGWSAMVDAAPERFHLYHPPSNPEAPFLGLIAATFGVALFYQSTNQVMIQRILSARSTWDGLMGIVFAGFINLVRPLVTCFLGFVVYHWTEVLHEAPSFLPDRQDEVFPFALARFAPSGLRGVILAGFLAAVMASASALANAVGTIFSLDVYRRLAPSADDRRLILVGRIASGASLALACLAAPLVASEGIFKYVQTGVTYSATPFVSVMILGVLWKRTSYTAALVGLVGGILIQTALGIANVVFGYGWHWLYVGAAAQALTMALIAATAWWAPAPATERQDLVWRPALLTQFEAGRRRPWYQRVSFWFAVFAGAWLTIYWRFW